MDNDKHNYVGHFKNPIKLIILMTNEALKLVQSKPYHTNV
jgi:hypothetical protein